MAFFDNHDHIDYQQFSINRLIKKAAKHADGLDPDEISAHPLRATALTFWANISIDSKVLKDLANWQDIQTAG
jgi:integrase